jgi:3-dehydroquinate synthase
MSIISVGKGETKYNIHISGNNFPKAILNKHLKNKNKILIITDDGIPKNHIKKLKNTINNKNVYIFSLKSGEKSKSFSSYQKILNKLFELKFDRSDIVIAFGGGVVGDITGFSAATYMRGIKYIQIPTTLLAQVDSSVGGKTAINVAQGKNLVGAFYNPSLVIVSTYFLNTLSDEEFKSGLGEVVKYALIGNKKLRSIIERNSQQIISREESVLKSIIEESIKTKSKIVTKDEKENGIRAILNFGHTFGHAIEAYKNYKGITHGAAITLGMVIASRISFYEGYIKNYQLDNVVNLISSIGLRTDYSKYNYIQLKKYIKSDKKIKNGKLNLVLIDKNFNAFTTSKFNNKNILRAFN